MHLHSLGPQLGRELEQRIRRHLLGRLHSFAWDETRHRLQTFSRVDAQENHLRFANARLRASRRRVVCARIVCFHTVIEFHRTRRLSTRPLHVL
jgi:hypothetical protein